MDNLLNKSADHLEERQRIALLQQIKLDIYGTEHKVLEGGKKPIFFRQATSESGKHVSFAPR